MDINTDPNRSVLKLVDRAQDAALRQDYPRARELARQARDYPVSGVDDETIAIAQQLAQMLGVPGLE